MLVAAPVQPSETPVAPPTVSITSQPSGAEVRDGATVLGTTPLTLPLAADRTVTVHLDGFVDATEQLTPGSAAVRVTLVAAAPIKPKPHTKPSGPDIRMSR